MLELEVFDDLAFSIGEKDAERNAFQTDIIGPNSHFVAQSGVFPKVFTDFAPEVVQDKNDKASDIVNQALSTECNVHVTADSTRMWRLLGGLGSHDLSAMREAIGMPKRAIGASFNLPFWWYVSL